MKIKGTAKRMNREDRRNQILDSAMTVFVEKGFSSTTTLEIAKAAGISEVTLFRYFSSKREIFLEGIEPILFNTLKGSMDSTAELSTEAKLEHIIYERVSLISRNYEVVKLILTEAPLLSELGSENFMERILEILKNLLTQIGISAENKEFTLRLLMGSILSFLYMPEKDEEKIKSYVNRVTSLILKQVKE